jgi:hypothetical protein
VVLGWRRRVDEALELVGAVIVLVGVLGALALEQRVELQAR